MKSKRIMSALLAGVMLTSTVLASCSKQEKEPPKSKRTNVYSGDEITLPADISYIDRIDYKNGKLYATYNTTYTITRNELGEEVERRVGYFWDDGANDVPVDRRDRHARSGNNRGNLRGNLNKAPRRMVLRLSERPEPYRNGCCDRRSHHNRNADRYTRIFSVNGYRQ